MTSACDTFLALVDEFHAETEKRSFSREVELEHLLRGVISQHAANHDDAVYLRDFIARKDSALKAFSPELGDAFAKVLEGWLTADQWAEMRRRNVDNDPECASQDFCDANMAMVEAYEKLTGREIFVDRWHEAIGMELLNAAWSYAKAKHLTEGVPA